MKKIKPIDLETTYSKEDLLSIAVRFFYPSFIINSKLQAYVCIGINGMDDFPLKRDLVIEGFLFQTIFENLDNPKYGIRVDFENAKRVAENVRLSNNEEKELQRAQGFVWAIMYKSKGLWKAITDYYNKMKNILPFKISGV